MAEPVKLATLECSTCSAWIDVFQQYEPDFALVWDARDSRRSFLPAPAVDELPSGSR